jgi:DNA-binding CsgD family transcriptional regulator
MDFTPITQTLLGREQDIQSLCQRLELHSWVTITGTGGVGKTSVARAVADQSSQVVVWVDGTCFETLEGLMSEILVALQPEARVANLTELSTDIRETARLLVLDNLEQIQDAGDAVNILLELLVNTSVLATSRIALNSMAEHCFPLLPLDVLPGGAASQLLFRPLRMRKPNWQASPQELAMAANICQRLDGLPLAIELVSYRLKALPLLEVAKVLEDDWLLSLRHDRATKDSHYSLEAVVRWSLLQVSDGQKRLLLLLTHAAGGISFVLATALAEAIEGMKLGELVELLDLGLLKRQGDMIEHLETIKAVVRNQFNDHEQAESQRVFVKGVAAYLHALMYADDPHGSRILGEDPSLTLKLQLDLKNYLHVARAQADVGEIEAALDTLHYVGDYLLSISQEHLVWGITEHLLHQPLTDRQRFFVLSKDTAFRSFGGLAQPKILETQRWLVAQSFIHGDTEEQFSQVLALCKTLIKFKLFSETETFLPQLESLARAFQALGNETLVAMIKGEIKRGTGDFKGALLDYQVAQSAAEAESVIPGILVALHAQFRVNVALGKLETAYQLFTKEMSLRSFHQVPNVDYLWRGAALLAHRFEAYELALRCLSQLMQLEGHDSEPPVNQDQINTFPDSLIINELLAILGIEAFRDIWLEGQSETEGTMLAALAETYEIWRAQNKAAEFSTRERTLLQCLTEGMTNKRIALQLQLSPLTVRNQLSELYFKIGCKNRVEAVEYAKQLV